MFTNYLRCNNYSLQLWLHFLFKGWKIGQWKTYNFIYMLQRNYEGTDVILRRMMSLFAETIYESAPCVAQSKTNIKPHSNNVYLLKRNSIAQAFLLTANMLEVGLFANTK